MRKILLADDSVTAQNMGRKILVDAGYEVLTVNNGSAALKRITESKPDVIILDVYMPGYSGLELCQRLKDSQETAHIPVLLSVGKLEPFKPQEARRVKANAHIIKPFEASELLTAIAHLEDSIVPQGRRPGFAAPPAGIGEDLSWRTDSAFKNDSQFSSKKKDESESVARFRDFRKAKANGSSASAAQETAGSSAGKPSAIGSDIVSDMPRGITREELDVLSALAAKLDEPTIPAPVASAAAQVAIPPVSEVAPPVEEAPIAAPTMVPTVGHAASVKFEVQSPKAEAAEQSAAMAEDAVEIPAETVEPACEAVPPPEQSAHLESAAIQYEHVESQRTESSVESQVESNIESHYVQSQQSQDASSSDETVNSAVFAIEAAPIDAADEPFFAAAVSPQEHSDSQPFEVVGSVPQPLEAKGEQSQAEPNKSEEVKAEDAKAEKPVAEEPTPVEPAPEVPVAAASQEVVEAEVPAPSEDELAEALRLLTPAATQAEATVPEAVCAQATGEGHDQAGESQNTAPATLSQSRDYSEQNDSQAKGGWLAEAVSLTPEEAAMSLEAEMFRSFAAASTEEIDSTPASSRVETITAAVENRLLAEASERNQIESDKAPKVMAAAAAAAADGPPTSEDGEIASIVDKVLADLRPKIVEEITKKLGKTTNG